MSAVFANVSIHPCYATRCRFPDARGLGEGEEWRIIEGLLIASICVHVDQIAPVANEF